jgi:phosphoglycerate dehydrogenase-like enzyme
MMHIYVENEPALPKIFSITEQMVRDILPAGKEAVQITVRSSNDMDVAQLQNADIFVGAGLPTRALAEHGRNLKLVHCLTAGVEGYMPLDWLPAGAVFTNSSGVHAEKSSLFGLMAILMLNEGMPRHATNQRKHLWDKTLPTAVAGKTVLIYGFGAIGQAVASKLRVLGVRIVGIRRSPENHVDADQISGPAMLHELLPSADFLVLSCPLTSETRGLIGAEELALMPRGACVLNIARGPVLDNDALRGALMSGHISGAIVDVFDPEPLSPDSDLWDIPNLTILPHVSCDDPNGYIDRCLSIVADNLNRLAQGRPLRNVVDRELGY